MGLIQIMPQTWTDLRARYGLGADLYDPHDNIVAGAAYIRELHDRYGSPGFLAGLGVTKIIRRQVDRFRMRPKRTSQRSSDDQGGPSSGQIIAVVKSFTWAGSTVIRCRTVSNSTVDRPPHDVHPNHPLSDRAVVDLSALVPQSGNLFVHRTSAMRSR